MSPISREVLNECMSLRHTKRLLYATFVLLHRCIQLGQTNCGVGYVQSVVNCPLPQKLTGLLATNKKKNLMLQHLINLFYYSNVHAIFPYFSLLLGFVLCFMILFLLSDSWFSNSFLHHFSFFSLINGLFSCRKLVSH